MANNFKQGWSTVGGKTHWFRSGFEVRWARYLEFLKQEGEIYDWVYEPKDFYFEGIRRGTVSYKPDFQVYYYNIAPPYIWHETKGYLQQKNVTQLRRMAKYYPNEKIILVMQNIPNKSTKKNTEKFRRMENAAKYVERVMDGGEQLRKVGL